MRSFALKGYAGSSMRTIAGDAGVTASALYNYYPSKAALFAAAWHEALEELYTVYLSALASQDSIVGDFIAVIDSAAQILRERSWVAQMAVRAVTESNREELEPILLSAPPVVADFYRALTSRAIARGEIDKGEAATVQLFLFMLLWDLCSIPTYLPFPIELDDLVAAARWSIEGRFRKLNGRSRWLTGTAGGRPRSIR